jgi:hypothetical protein
MNTTVKDLVADLKKSVEESNRLMEELGKLGVEVRVSYIESNLSKNIPQGLSLWKVIEHIDHLAPETSE